MPEGPAHHSGRRPAIPTPTMLADRLGVSVAAVVLGTAAVLAAAAGGWWALRTPPGPTPEEILPMAGAVEIPVPSPAPVRALPIVVHVDGAVARPGVHELPAGSRVLDAVAAAGGLVAQADGDRLNLAEPLSDGTRLWVPLVGEQQPPDLVRATPGSAAVVPAGSVGGVTVNINSADVSALQSLPGIGPAIAAAIVEHRHQHGPFTSVGDLDKVPGIGAGRLDQIRDLVSV